MQKILFLAINSKFIHTNPALLYLRAITPHSYISEIAEYTANQHSYDILADIFLRKPDIIAFSAYVWNTVMIQELLVDIARLLPGSVIVLGGPEVSYNPQKWLTDFPQIGYIITGAGESGWLELIGSSFKHSQKIISKQNISFDEIPFIYDEQTISRYKTESRIIYYESSRGCPFKCSFCLSSRSDIKLEYRSIAKAKKELSFFIAKDIPLVKFIDRTFNSSPRHARAVWSYLIDNHKNTCFHFEINPYLLSDEDIALLRQAPQNLFQFEIGIQSTHLPTLKEINRIPDNLSGNSLSADIVQKIKLLMENIDIHLDLVFGLPYEDFCQAQSSFDTVYNMKAKTFQPGMLKVLPGTEIADKTSQYEMIYQSKPPYRILRNKWISFEQLNLISNIEHLVNNLYNSHKFDRTIDYMVAVYGSAFQLFSELAAFWQKNSVNYHLKDWNKTAELLLNFMPESRIHDYQMMLDCLRWDLCFLTGFNSYPPFLLDKQTKELLTIWSGAKKNKQVDLPAAVLKSRKAMIYKPTTALFRELYGIQENDCSLAVKQDNGKIQAINIDFDAIKQ